MKTITLISVTMLFLLTACVSQKKYSELQNSAELCETNLKNISNERLILENNLANEKSKSKALEQQIKYFKSTNTNSTRRNESYSRLHSRLICQKAIFRRM